MDDNVREVQMIIRRRDRGYVLFFCLMILAVSSWLVAEAGLSAVFSRRQETNSLLVREFSTRAHLAMLQIIQSSAQAEHWQDAHPQTWCARGLFIQYSPCACPASDPSCLEVSIGDTRLSAIGIVRDVRIHSPALHPLLPSEAIVNAVLGVKCRKWGVGACEEFTLRIDEWQVF